MLMNWVTFISIGDTARVSFRILRIVNRPKMVIDDGAAIYEKTIRLQRKTTTIGVVSSPTHLLLLLSQWLIIKSGLKYIMIKIITIIITLRAIRTWLQWRNCTDDVLLKKRSTEANTNRTTIITDVTSMINTYNLHTIGFHVIIITKSIRRIWVNEEAHIYNR